MAKNKLELGDTTAAIIQLQKMQAAFPLCSLVEIIENGIDAGSSKIDITRRRRGGKTELIFQDYGRGISAGSDGNSDMHRVRTSICNSDKIQESLSKRALIQGEFGIGILGFAAISENLEILSRTETSKLIRSMTLKAFSVDCDISSRTTDLDIGTHVKMWPVHDVIDQRFTGEKLNKFLGAKMADRIRESSVVITIYDKIRKKTFSVKPLDYKGERIPVGELRLPGNRKVKLELYIAQQKTQGTVALVRKGTRLLEDISEIDELDREPWNNPLLEGRIHNRFVGIMPNRSNVIIDENFQELIEAMKDVEEKIIEILKKVEKKRNQLNNQKRHVLLKKGMGNTFLMLPQDEWAWFGEKGQLSISQEGFIDDKDTVKSKNEKSGGQKGPQKNKMVTLSSGPLSYLQITPNNYYAIHGETVKLQAAGWTAKGEKIHNSDLKYEWKVRPTYMGEISIEGDTCSFIAGDSAGKVEIEVNATLDFEGRVYKAKKYAEIVVDKSSSKKKGKAGFLRPIAVDMSGESWRSRKTDYGIEYNTGHKDYKIAEKNNNVLRYLLVLFSTHLVYHNFGGMGEDVISERMIEVITALDNMNGKKK